VSRSITALTLALLVCAATSAPAQTFVFDLRASQEVPPNPSTAIGGGFGNLDQPNATFAITCVHDVAGATIMHIHRGAPGQALPAFAVADIPAMSWWIAVLSTMAIAAVAWLRLRG